MEYFIVRKVNESLSGEMCVRMCFLYCEMCAGCGVQLRMLV